MKVSIRILTILTVFLSGLLAGGNTDRYVVQVPAWHQTGVEAWATYSRHADLGNGLFLYPSEGISVPLLALIILLLVLPNRKDYVFLITPIAVTLVLSFIGLFLTVFAAPQMLSLRHLMDNPVLLQHAFREFHFWGSLRAVFQILAFAASLWMMARVFASEDISR